MFVLVRIALLLDVCRRIALLVFICKELVYVFLSAFVGILLAIYAYCHVSIDFSETTKATTGMQRARQNLKEAEVVELLRTYFSRPVLSGVLGKDLARELLEPVGEDFFVVYMPEYVLGRLGIYD